MAASIGPIAASFIAARAALLPPLPTGGVRLLDVGGGDGTLGLALVREFSDLRVEVYNLPVVRPLVETKARDAAGRLGFVSGDFNPEPAPGATKPPHPHIQPVHKIGSSSPSAWLRQ